MKKIFLTLFACLSAFAAWAITPEELVGTWESKETTIPSEMREITMKVKSKYTFNADGSLEMKSTNKVTLNIGEGMYVDLFATLNGAGTYTLDGDTINEHLDKERTNFVFNQDDMKVRGCEDEDMAEKIIQQLYPPMAAQLQMQEYDNKLVVVMFVGNKMTIKEDELTLTFTKKKK